MSTIDLCRIYVDGSILQYDERSGVHHVCKERALFWNGNMLLNENKIFMTHLFFLLVFIYYVATIQTIDYNTTLFCMIFPSCMNQARVPVRPYVL